MTRGETFTIRRASLSDAAAIANVFLVTRSRCLGYLPKIHPDDETRQWIADVVVKLPNVFVCEMKNDVVGFAAATVDHLDHLYVLPELHGRGIGAALLREIKQACPRGFTLWLFQQNTLARKFYNAHGLILLRETDGHGNEERTPDAEYAWQP